jgi:hypothetical protein
VRNPAVSVSAHWLVRGDANADHALMSDHAAAIWQIAYTATQSRRQDLLAALVARTGWIVQAGPFAGLALPERASQDDRDALPKLLGFYESELHPVLADIIADAPDLIIDIGAGLGYYACGFARALPEAFVHAFYPAPEVQELCRQTAALNNVNTRVSVAGTCRPDLLNALLPRGRVPLIVCDCEGQERELIDPQRVPTLRSATLVIECHDFVDPSITSLLVERLCPTHELMGVAEGARNPNESEFLRGLHSLDRWLAVCEYRPTIMHWLAAQPRG